MLVRHHRGERVWSVLREPSKGDEDERREHREHERLIHERTSLRCPGGLAFSDADYFYSLAVR
jgi:hypothetical protein